MSASFSGPIPPPNLLAEYNSVIPNGAERIMVMAERQSAHRERLEARVIDGNVASQTRGAYFAFIISLVAITGGIGLIYLGRGVDGLAVIIASITGLAGTFIYTKQQQSRELRAKSDALQTRKSGA